LAALPRSDRADSRVAMRLHQLLFGGALVLCVVFISRVLVQDQLSTKRPPASTANLERSITALVQQQRRVETRLEVLASDLSKLRLPPRSRPIQAEALTPVATEAAALEVEVTAAAEKAVPAAEPTDAECPERRSYHALLTAQSSHYQQWQARIMYFHWQKQKAVQGRCGDMGGFTRLCATKGGEPDGLEGEIPSLFTAQLPDAVIAAHFHFGVLNRPHSVQALLDSPEMLAQITSRFVLILETDHVLMRPIPNLATEDKPAAFVFGYMHGNKAQDAIVRRYWPQGSGSLLDPVGPSPLLIHLDQLRRLTPRWLNFSFGLRSNGDAERVMQGWVQEMWAYTIAAASVGISHRQVRDFQVEHGSSGRPAEDFTEHAYIFHYTYGIEYTMSGQPQGVNQIGEWSLDKRHYGGDYPPRNLQPPPDGANAAARWLLGAWNEASAGISSWPQSKSMGTLGWRRNRISSAELEASATARGAQGVLSWSWAGTAGFVFKPGGQLQTPWGQGTWGVVRDANDKAGPTAYGAAAEEIILRCNGCIFADFANANHNLVVGLDATTGKASSFRAIRVGDLAEVKGVPA